MYSPKTPLFHKYPHFPRMVMDDQDQESLNRIKELLPGVKFLTRSECNLLGAAITDEALPEAILAKFEEIERLISRLPNIEPHIALFLVRNCLAIPKLVYTLPHLPRKRTPSRRHAESPGIPSQRYIGRQCVAPSYSSGFKGWIRRS